MNYHRNILLLFVSCMVLGLPVSAYAQITKTLDSLYKAEAFDQLLAQTDSLIANSSTDENTLYHAYLVRAKAFIFLSFDDVNLSVSLGKNAKKELVGITSDSLLGLANSICHTLIKLQPQNGKGYQLLAKGHFLKGNLDSCIIVANTAISLDSMLAPAYYNAGLSYFVQEKYREGIPFLERAYQLDKTDETIPHNLAAGYKIIGNYQKELEYINIALSYPSIQNDEAQWKDLLLQRSTLWYNLQQFEKSLEDAMHIVEKDKAYAEYSAYTIVGNCYVQLGDKSEAKKVFTSLLEMLQADKAPISQIEDIQRVLTMLE